MNCLNVLILLTLFAISLAKPKIQAVPEVTIDQGVLSGRNSDDGTFFEYLGIPYATSNSSTRFQAPLPAPTWTGVFNAVQEGSICPQLTGFGVVGDENNCLVMNVYVPSEIKGPVSVMIYIHGGGFLTGSSGKAGYSADFFINKDVILVTFNYRLGVLGFMCLDIKEAPGNAGLRDQIAALKWVKRNIAAFGGDPDNITIFGESAGATSVSLLLASHATEGLFQKAIVQSGSSISNWAINRRPIWSASLLAKDLGHDTEDPRELYDLFTSVSYQDLVSKDPFKPINSYLETELLNLPCVEKPFEGVEPVLSDLPYNLLQSRPKNIPIIYGSTNLEGLLFTHAYTAQTYEEKIGLHLCSDDIGFDSEEEAESVAIRLHEFYFGTERINANKFLNLTDAYTHYYFEIPEILEAEIFLSSSTDAPIYNFYFPYNGNRNFIKFSFGYGHLVGATHADDLPYMFGSYNNMINEKDLRTIERLTTMWTNFAKYGDPTPELTSDLQVKWEPSTRDRLNFLYIDDELTMGPLPSKAAYDLWKDIYAKYRLTTV